MRRENPPAGGHDKVIWKRSRDRSRDKATRKRNCETWWRLTTATLLGFSFGSYRRRRRDILMGRRGYVPFIRLGEVTLRRRWVFYLRVIWDVLMECLHYFSLTRCHEIPIRRHEDVPVTCLDDGPLRRLWVFHLRRICDVAATYRETLLRRRHDVLLPDGH